MCVFVCLFACVFVCLLLCVFPGKGGGPGFSLSGRALALVRGGDFEGPADIESVQNASKSEDLRGRRI